MAAYRFGHSSCNSGPFPFKIGLKYAHLQGLYCSHFNQLQLFFFGSVLLGFCGFFILESENCNCQLQKNWLQSSFFTGFFQLLQPDFETLLMKSLSYSGATPSGSLLDTHIWQVIISALAVPPSSSLPVRCLTLSKPWAVGLPNPSFATGILWMTLPHNIFVSFPPLCASISNVHWPLLGVSCWSSTGWQLPLGVSHWLPHWLTS